MFHLWAQRLLVSDLKLLSSSFMFVTYPTSHFDSVDTGTNKKLLFVGASDRFYLFFHFVEWISNDFFHFCWAKFLCPAICLSFHPSWCLYVTAFPSHLNANPCLSVPLDMNLNVNKGPNQLDGPGLCALHCWDYGVHESFNLVLFATWCYVYFSTHLWVCLVN